MPFYSGSELRLMRRSRAITQEALAKVMGVDQSRIAQLEARAVVPVKSADRYLRALRETESAA